MAKKSALGDQSGGVSRAQYRALTAVRPETVRLPLTRCKPRRALRRKEQREPISVLSIVVLCFSPCSTQRFQAKLSKLRMCRQASGVSNLIFWTKRSYAPTDDAGYLQSIDAHLNGLIFCSALSLEFAQEPFGYVLMSSIFASMISFGNCRYTW